jgi:hypothetical protein
VGDLLDPLFYIYSYFPKKKSDSCSIMDTAALHIPIKQIRDFSISTLNVSDYSNLSLQQGASQLRRASANLGMILINRKSQWRIYFPLLNPTKLHHYHITKLCYYLVLKFYSTSSSSNSIQFFIIYVPSQQPQGQLQTEHKVDTSNYIMDKHNIKTKTNFRLALEGNTIMQTSKKKKKKQTNSNKYSNNFIN